jgi:hypothetical protein
MKPHDFIIIIRCSGLLAFPERYLLTWPSADLGHLYLGTSADYFKDRSIQIDVLFSSSLRKVVDSDHGSEFCLRSSFRNFDLQWFLGIFS